MKYFTSEAVARLLGVSPTNIFYFEKKGAITYRGPKPRGRIGRQWSLSDVIRIKFVFLLSHAGVPYREAGAFVQGAIDDRLVGQILAGEASDLYIKVARQGQARQIDLTEQVGGDLAVDGDSISLIHLAGVMDSLKLQI